MKSMQEIYMEGQAACGLKVGDQVKVLRQPKSCEYGWNNLSPYKDYTGEMGTITAMCHTGIRLKLNKDDVYMFYPYFVLEKIEEVKPKHDFKTFDQVLVRNESSQEWLPTFFIRLLEDKHYKYCKFEVMTGGVYRYCIPYEGNEELAFTTNNPKNDNEK